MSTLDAIAKAMGGEVKGKQARFPTPGHSEHDRGSTAELVPEAPDGVLIRSFNGGDPIEIKDKLRAEGILPKLPRWEVTGRYDFRDETGDLLYYTERLEHPDEPKKYQARLPNGSFKIGKVRRVLYRLPELLAADPSGFVFMPEGERKADKLASWGLVATAFAFGAKSWRKEYAERLAGRTVILLPDNDDEGRSMAQRAARDIQAAGGTVRIVALPGLPAKGDIINWGGTCAELVDLARNTPEWSAPATKQAEDKPAKPRAAPAVRIDLPAGFSAAQMLDEVHALLGRFVAYPSQHAHVAHTLWIGHAHAMGAWESTPRIAFLSPEPGSGKTRALEITETLVPRPVEAVNVTPAYLFRKVGDEAGRPTILYDEIDTVFGPKAKDNEEIRGLLNAGHRCGAVAGRCVVRGKEIMTEEIPAYCAVAFAGLGDLPDTILARSVPIRMRRRAPNEQVQPYRRREHAPLGHRLRDQLAAWASEHEDALADARPEMPSGVVDRDADVWEPLLAVADAAGGDWPERARVSAVTLVTLSRAATPSLGIRLLSDLRTLFADRDHLATSAILSELHAIEDAPWGDMRGKALDSRGLAQRLKKYEVKPTTVRIGHDTHKGYRREDLHDTFERYFSPLGSPPYEAVTRVTSVTDDRADPPSLFAAHASALTATCPRCEGDGCAWCEVQDG